GTSPTLAVDANAVRIAYLRFEVNGLASRTILGAVLHLQADSSPGAESDSGGVLHTITDGTWQENSITYTNRPTVDGPTVASQGPVALGQTVEFNVASAITADGTYNFAIVNTSADECDYRSREGGPAPKLVITVAGNPPRVTIGSPADGSVSFRNHAVTLSATASDARDGDISSQIQWTSSRDGALGTGATISPTTLTTGTHIITAGATDSDSLHGQAQVSIRVRDPNVAPVELGPRRAHRLGRELRDHAPERRDAPHHRLGDRSGRAHRARAAHRHRAAAERGPGRVDRGPDQRHLAHHREAGAPGRHGDR